MVKNDINSFGYFFLKFFSFDLERRWITIESIKFSVEHSTVSIVFSFLTFLFTEVYYSFYLSYFCSVIICIVICLIIL